MISSANVTAITSDLAQEAFTDAFRAEVGHGKPFSRSSLAEVTGFDTTTIGSWMDGKSCPCLHKMLRLMAVLGPRFTNRILAVAGLGDAVRLEPERACILEVHAAGAELVQKVASFLVDPRSPGRIDPGERAALVPHIRRLHEISGDFLQAEGNVSPLRQAG